MPAPRSSVLPFTSEPVKAGSLESSRSAFEPSKFSDNRPACMPMPSCPPNIFSFAEYCAESLMWLKRPKRSFMNCNPTPCIEFIIITGISADIYAV